MLGQLVLDGRRRARRRCSATTRPTRERLWGLPGRSRVPEGRHQRPRRRTAPPRSTRPASAPRRALHYVLDVPAGGETRRSGCGSTAPRRRRAPAAPPARPRRRLRRGHAPRGGPRPTRSSPSWSRRRAARRGGGGPAGDRRADVGQAVLPLRRGAAGSTATRPPTPPPPGRRHGRNSAWWHMNSFDVISMPDPWEYPWYAAWDLAFHCVAIARVDPGFAKEQLLLLLREWYMHPNGQIPAYEWAFGDVNPPVHAWAALQVFEIDGGARLRLPRPGDAQAAAQLHLVGQPQGHRRQQRLRGRLPRPGQRRPVRPVRGAAGGRRAGAVRRHRLDGDVRAEPARHGARAGHARPRRTRTSRRSSSSTSRTSPRPPTSRACGTTRTRSSTTCCGCPTAHEVPLKVRSVVGLLPLARDHHAHLGHAGPAARARRPAALVPDQQARVRRRDRRPPAVRRRPAAAAAVDGRARTS